MKILLIDDDRQFLELFESYINNFCREVFQNFKIHKLNSINESVFNADLIFLDIDLNGFNSIDIAKKFKMNNKNAVVIFVTSRENLVFKTLKVQPFYFIRKNQLNQDLGIAFSLLRKHYLDKLTYTFTENGRKKILYLDDIVYLECNDHITSLITTSETFDFYRSLKDMMEMLKTEDYSNIVQIHKKYCVNFLHIEDIRNDVVKLSNDKRVKIGRKYKDEFYNNYTNFIKE